MPERGRPRSSCGRLPLLLRRMNGVSCLSLACCCSSFEACGVFGRCTSLTAAGTTDVWSETPLARWGSQLPPPCSRRYDNPGVPCRIPVPGDLPKRPLAGSTRRSQLPQRQVVAPNHCNASSPLDPAGRSRSSAFSYPVWHQPRCHHGYQGAGGRWAPGCPTPVVGGSPFRWRKCPPSQNLATGCQGSLSFSPRGFVHGVDHEHVRTLSPEVWSTSAWARKLSSARDRPKPVAPRRWPGDCYAVEERSPLRSAPTSASV